MADSASVRATTSVGTPQHVGGETRRDQAALVLRRRDQHLAAHVAALLLRRELVFEMDAGRAGFDDRPS